MNIEKTRTSEIAAFGSIGSLQIAVIVLAVLLAPVCRGYAQEEADMQALKEQIKQEILNELRGGSVSETPHSAEFDQLKQEIKNEILREMQLDTRSTARGNALSEVTAPQLTPREGALDFVPKGAGDAEGQMLRRGTGLANCKVRLVRLSGVSTRYRGFTEGNEFEALTSVDGRYRFENVSPGTYKLKWQPSGEDGWTRRLWDKPDVTIRPGQTGVLKPVETARILAPR